MKRRLISVCAVLGLTDCAHFNTTQTRTEIDGQGKPTAQVVTKATAYTLFTSKSQLTNWKATQSEKTQGASVGTLAQESSTTNEATLIQATVSSAVSAAVKAAVVK